MNNNSRNQKSRSDSKSKKKFDSYVADSANKSTNGDRSSNSNGNRHPHHVVKTESGTGFSFVAGSFGALDCSIGSIFRDEFGQNLKMPKTSQEQLGRALSVLIIDDSIIQRKLTMRTLGGLIDEVMWMVEGAENGECALNLIETSPRVPDVIIVDQYMETSGGQLLGHEVVAELRRNTSFDTAVIIGCTGSVQEAGPYFLEAGCDAVWSKPMPSKDEAHAQIMTLLQKRQNNSLLGGESLSCQSSSPIFTLENNSGFSSGTAPQQQSKHPPSPVRVDSQHPPVFRQMQSDHVRPDHTGMGANQQSYFVSTTAANGSERNTGSVFQFGVPPSSSSSISSDGVQTSPRQQELENVTDTLSSIQVTE
jgi:CheY-like chemotaxis protein